MTKEELKTYLIDYLEDFEGTKCYVNALRYHLNQIEEYSNIPIVREEQKQVRAIIKKETERVTKKHDVIFAWSLLIDDPTRRSIFIDRYINRLTWTQLEVKYSYSRSNIFNIHKKACSEIVRKAVSDLTATEEPTSLVQ